MTEIIKPCAGAAVGEFKAAKPGKRHVNQMSMPIGGTRFPFRRIPYRDVGIAQTLSRDRRGAALVIIPKYCDLSPISWWAISPRETAGRVFLYPFLENQII